MLCRYGKLARYQGKDAITRNATYHTTHVWEHAAAGSSVNPAGKAEKKGGQDSMRNLLNLGTSNRTVLCFSP